jgi:hypothetical protein
MPDASAGMRRQVQSRALGRCEYCLLPEKYSVVSHEVDHILAVKHGGLTEGMNLAWCCFACNRYKGSDISSIDPLTGNTERLYNPRRDRWDEHFRLVSGHIQPLTAVGRVTARLPRFNTPAGVEVRLKIEKAGLFEVEGVD